MTSGFFNNTDKEAVLQARFTDPVKQDTHPSTVEYVIPAGRLIYFPTDIFFKESVEENKHLDVHLIVEGLTHCIFEHDAFNENESAILERGNDGSLKTRFSPMEKKEGALLYWFRCVLQNLGKRAHPDLPVHLPQATG